MNSKEIKIQDKTIKLETGKIAKQTSGSVMVTSGETVVLVTVCASKGDAEDRGFFPYQLIIEKNSMLQEEFLEVFLKRSKTKRKRNTCSKVNR